MLRIQCVGWNHQAHLPAEQCEGACLPKRANEREKQKDWVGSKSLTVCTLCRVSFRSHHLRKVHYLVPAAAGGVCCRSVPSRQTITERKFKSVPVLIAEHHREQEGRGLWVVFFVYRHCGIWCVLNPPPSLPPHHTTSHHLASFTCRRTSSRYRPDSVFLVPCV